MRKQNQIVLAWVATVGEWGEIQVYSPRAVFFFFSNEAHRSDGFFKLLLFNLFKFLNLI